MGERQLLALARSGMRPDAAVPNRVIAHTNIARACASLGWFRRAVRNSNAVRAVCEPARRVGGAMQPANRRAALMMAHRYLGNAFHGLHMWEEAAAHHRQQLAIAQENIVNDRRRECFAFCDLGNALSMVCARVCMSVCSRVNVRACA